MSDNPNPVEKEMVNLIRAVRRADEAVVKAKRDCDKTVEDVRKKEQAAEALRAELKAKHGVMV